MAKQNTEDTKLNVEQAMEHLFHAAAPNPAFVADLEQRLLAQAAPQGQPVLAEPFLVRAWRALTQPFRSRRWATLPLVLLLTLLLTMTVIGPRRVLAEVQRLLGYVPGIGFVNLERSRVLAAPVEQTRDGVTLRISEVLATPDGTDVVLRSEGVPPEPQGPRGEETIEAFQPRLRLPDGSTLEAHEFELRYGEGTLHFPPLPEGVHRVTLELPQLPLVAEGQAPESWAVPLTLLPANGDLVEALYAQPYQPIGATDTHQGITLRVLEAAHSPEETALTVEVAWENPEWDLRGGIGGRRLPELQDDVGHVMAYQSPSNRGSVSVVQVEVDPYAAPPEETPKVWQQTLAFPPISPSAQQLTLWMESLEVRAPAEAAFTLDLGANPQVGDTWQLNEQLNVLGFPIRVVGARLERVVEQGEEQLRLTFQIEKMTARVGGRELFGLSLQGLSFPAQEGGGSGWSRGSQRMSRYLYLSDVPSGVVTVEVTEAYFWLEGPWQLTWEMPGAAENGQSAVPVVQRQLAHDTQDGITLRVEEAVRTDRLTQVRLGAEGLPDGMRFRRPLPVDPATLSRESGLTLADNLGGRYDFQWNLRWQSLRGAVADDSTWSDEKRLAFPGVNPLAEEVTLHIPTIEAAVHDPLTVEVSVPEEVELHPTEHGERISDPWPVDIALDIGGFPFRFSEARLRTNDRDSHLELRSDVFAGVRGPQRLTGLDIVAITAPDGQATSLDGMQTHAGPTNRVEMTRNQSQLMLSFDISNPGGFGWLPGTYRIELDGAIVAISGPWELTWSVR